MCVILLKLKLKNAKLRGNAARVLEKYARLYSDNRPLEVGSRVEITLGISCWVIDEILV